MKTVSKKFVQLLFLYQTTVFLSDNNFVMLLDVIRFFVWILWSVLSHNLLKELYDSLPKTMYMAKKMIGIDEDSMYIRWVVCINCSQLYSWDEVVEKRTVVKCSHVKYPNHPRRSGRKPCGTRLIKKVVSADGRKVNCYPRKIYCPRSIKNSLERLLKKKKRLQKFNFFSN